MSKQTKRPRLPQVVVRPSRLRKESESQLPGDDAPQKLVAEIHGEITNIGRENREDIELLINQTISDDPLKRSQGRDNLYEILGSDAGSLSNSQRYFMGLSHLLDEQPLEAERLILAIESRYTVHTGRRSNLLGLANLTSGKIEEAVSAFKQAIDIITTSTNKGLQDKRKKEQKQHIQTQLRLAYTALISILRIVGDHDDANKHWDSAMSKGVFDIKENHTARDFYKILKQFIPQAKHIAKSNPLQLSLQDGASPRELSLDIFNLYFSFKGTAKLAISSENQESAKNLLRQLQLKYPNAPETLDISARVCLSEGQSISHLEEPLNSISHDKAISPLHHFLYLGCAAVQSENLPKAVDYFKRAKEIAVASLEVEELPNSMKNRAKSCIDLAARALTLIGKEVDIEDYESATDGIISGRNQRYDQRSSLIIGALNNHFPEIEKLWPSLKALDQAVSEAKRLAMNPSLIPKAIEILERILEARPHSRRIRLLLADMQLEIGEWKKSAINLRALDQGETSPRAEVLYRQALISTKYVGPKYGIKCFQKVIHSAKEEIKEFRGKELKGGALAKSIHYLKSALRASIAIMSQLGMTGNLNNLIGCLRRIDEEYPEIKPDSDRLQQILPNIMLETNIDITKQKFSAAQRHILKDDLNQAEKILIESLKEVPNNLHNKLLLLSVYFAQSKEDEIREIEETLEPLTVGALDSFCSSVEARRIILPRPRKEFKTYLYDLFMKVTKGTGGTKEVKALTFRAKLNLKGLDESNIAKRAEETSSLLKAASSIESDNYYVYFLKALFYMGEGNIEEAFQLMHNSITKKTPNTLIGGLYLYLSRIINPNISRIEDIPILKIFRDSTDIPDQKVDKMISIAKSLQHKKTQGASNVSLLNSLWDLGETYEIRAVDQLARKVSS